MIHVTREDGHLIVAAVRILEHREQTPPGHEAVAELIRMPVEALRLKVAALEELGILQRVESALDTHVEVRDHALLDDLEPTAESSAMEEDLADFDRRKQQEADRMARLFADGDHEKKRREKIKEMDEGLFDYEKRKPRDPFADGE